MEVKLRSKMSHWPKIPHRYESSLIQFDRFWSTLIDFDWFWSILIDFDRFWTDLIQSDSKKVNPVYPKAVTNLIRVGKDTIASSQDSKLKNEMPKSLGVIENAADLLEKACHEMKSDPYSQAGRDRLIQGSRGILQGTT